MARGDLTTAAAVNQWLGSSIANDATAQATLARLITSASKFVLNYCNRSTFEVVEQQDVYDGTGASFMLLRQFPVISVESVGFYGTVLQPAVPGSGQVGYFLEGSDSAAGAQQRLTLFGYLFPRGRSNISVSYTTGYQTTEQTEIEAQTTYTTVATWLTDLGVVYGDTLLPLSYVASDPAPGQYAVAAGVYTFSDVDAGRPVNVSFGRSPEDIDHAVVELVGERFKVKDRIGENTKSLGGNQTASYSQKDMSDFIKSSLQPFRRVVPV